MAKGRTYDQYIEDLKKREQALRDDIEKQSTQLEKKVKSGLLVGLIAMILAAVLFVFFKSPSKNRSKPSSRSKGNWLIRWAIESVSMEVIRQFWQARKAKLKGS